MSVRANQWNRDSLKTAQDVPATSLITFEWLHLLQDKTTVLRVLVTNDFTLLWPKVWASILNRHQSKQHTAVPGIVFLNFCSEAKETLPVLLFLFCSLVAPAQKPPLSTLTRSPAVCSALAGSSSRRPFRSAPAPSRPSTLRYTPPLPPPPRPHRRRHPPCLTHWPIPHPLPLPCWLRATASLSTTACSSPRACPPTSAKVSSRAGARPGLFQLYGLCLLLLPRLHVHINPSEDKLPPEVWSASSTLPFQWESFHPDSNWHT